MSDPAENETPPEETPTEEKPEDQGDNAEAPAEGEQPLVRKKRALIDVPQRHNIGADGSPDEEFN